MPFKGYIRNAPPKVTILSWTRKCTKAAVVAPNGVYMGEKLECIGVEVMGPHFTKYHLSNGQVVHKFSTADKGHPHDHPWGFTSEILYGGYKEKVFGRSGRYTHYKTLLPGMRNKVKATTIHLITQLLGEECWTLVNPEPATQTSGFYDFREDGLYYRYWDEQEFKKIH